MGVAFAPGTSASKSATLTSRSRPWPSQSGQRPQPFESALHATACRLVGSHWQGHAQAARGDPNLVNRLLLSGLGARQVVEQALSVLAQKSRGGQFFLRAPRFHSAASLERESGGHKAARNGAGVYWCQ
jgi:hypothetical protein